MLGLFGPQGVRVEKDWGTFRSILVRGLLL